MPDAQVILGDCLEVMRGMPGASVDSIVTDPPYKLSQEYGSGADADNLLAVSSIWPAAAEMFRLAKPGGLCAMYYDTRILPLALEALRAPDLPGSAGGRRFRNDEYELLLPCCPRCHQEGQDAAHRQAQAAWSVKHFGREDGATILAARYLTAYLIESGLLRRNH